MEKIEGPSKEEKVERHEHEEMAAPPRKGGVFNTLYPPGPKPGAGPRMKNHCRKFWWCDLLVIVIIVLIIVLPVVFVAIPKKAQSDINASTLEVTDQEVTSPSADGIHLKLVSVAKSDSSYHPTIEGFHASLSLANQSPFLYIDVPEVKSEAQTEIVVDQDLKFASLDAFKMYNKVVMGSESFDVYLSGKTKVHQKGLQAISVDYNKKVTMKGLNKLQGLNITDLKILAGTDGPNAVLPDGSNMVGTVIIPNPSVMTLDLGNLTMDLSVDGKSIGTSLLPNLILTPGTNNYSMQSTVDQLTVIGLISSKYKDAVLPLEILGNSSVQGDVHLTYYEEAIQNNPIKLDLNVGPALKAINITIGG